MHNVYYVFLILLFCLSCDFWLLLDRSSLWFLWDFLKWIQVMSKGDDSDETDNSFVQSPIFFLSIASVYITLYTMDYGEIDKQTDKWFQFSIMMTIIIFVTEENPRGNHFLLFSLPKISQLQNSYKMHKTIHIPYSTFTRHLHSFHPDSTLVSLAFWLSRCLVVWHLLFVVCQFANSVSCET